MEEKVLGGYRLVRELGSGGMATVHLAEVVTPRAGLAAGDRVAVKILHRHLVTERSFYERFRREAEVGARIRHRNVVHTLDFGVAEDGATDNYLVMEYVEGQTLRALLGELQRVPEDLCRHIGREVANALVAVHEGGIIHRDLKPENVLITKDDVVKVMDLGVAFLADEAIRLSLTGQFVGSIFYAAPEQIQGGGKDLDYRVDLYQLGVLLYELATGTHPYRDDDLKVALRRLLVEEPRPLHDVNPQVSPFFEETVHTLMSRNRNLRFDSAAEVHRVLTEGEGSPWWSLRASEIRTRTRQPIRRIRIPRETALYGREKDLAALESLWERAKEGDAQVVLVTGDAGIGKSRLLDEFHQSLLRRDEECHFLFGTYRPGEAATASGAWSTAYREHLGGSDLEEALKHYVRTAPLLIPAFVALLLGEPPPEGEEPLTRESIQTVFLEVTRALAEERPVVVLVEDLQFAHEEGRALFAALTVALAGHRVLLVGTARPGLPRDWVAALERQVNFRQLPLGRLAPADIQSLLSDSLGSNRLAAALLSRIAVKSDGKPYYVFEILRGLREGQFIGELGDGTWVTTRAIREIRVPTSVRELIRDRIRGLEERDERMLGMASCIAFEFDPGLLAKALGSGRIPVLKRLGMIEKTSRLVRSVGRRYAFDDHQVQETIREDLPEEKRREYHLAIGCALEEREGGESADPRKIEGGTAVELLGHLLRGGRPDRAGRYLMPALEHLRDGYVNASAVELADLALEADGLLAGEGRVRVLLRKAEHLDLLGFRDEQRRALEEAFRIAEETGDPVYRSRTRLELGDHHRAVSELVRAGTLLGEAAALAADAGLPGLEAAAMGSLGLVAWHQGRHEEARTRNESAVALARRAGDERAEGGYLGNLGLVAFYRGLYEEAGRQHEEALIVARATEDRRNEAIHTGHLANALWAQGRWAEALELHEASLDIARRIGDRQGEGVAHLSLGLLQAQIGRPAEGLRLLEEGRSIFRQTSFRLGEAAAVHGLGMLAEEQGRPEDAERLYGESLDLRREIGVPADIAESLLSLGRLRGVQERTDAAARNLFEAMSLGRETGWPQTTVLASAYLALIARGDADLARAALVEHQGRLPRHARMEANLVLYKLEREEKYLSAAREILAELLDRAPAEWREPMRRNVRLHREILAARN